MNEERTYFQPDFYHFSEDSLLLSEHVVKRVHELNINRKGSFADLAAGCGVIGIEIMRRLNLKGSLVEKEEAFNDFIDKNLNEFNVKDQATILNTDLLELDLSPFSFVVSNPPYFRTGTGRLPTNLQKRNCRFHEDCFHQHYLKKLESYVNKDQAYAWLCMRLDERCEHWFNEIQKLQCLHSSSHYGHLVVYEFSSEF